jgi:hypothetical protein
MYIKTINKIIIVACGTSGMILTGGYDCTREEAKEGSKGLPIPNNSSFSL